MNEQPSTVEPGVSLEEYIAENRSSFTPEALRDAAAAAGYSRAEIDAAFAHLGESPGAGPVRAKARTIILLAYGITFVVLSAGMITNSGGGGIVILGPSLGLFLLLSLFMIRRRNDDATRLGLALGGLLAVPLIFLVIIAGLCLATGLPLHPFTL